MKTFAMRLASLGLCLGVVGCSDSAPSAPKGDVKTTWPDEVKEAEGKMEKQASENAAKYNTPKTKTAK